MNRNPHDRLGRQVGYELGLARIDMLDAINDFDYENSTVYLVEGVLRKGNNIAFKFSRHEEEWHIKGEIPRDILDEIKQHPQCSNGFSYIFVKSDKPKFVPIIYVISTMLALVRFVEILREHELVDPFTC